MFFFHIKCIQSTKITSQASNSGHYKISSVLTFCDAFHSFMLRTKLSNFVFSSFFKDCKLHLAAPMDSCNLVTFQKKLLVLIYSKLHSKSCNCLCLFTKITYKTSIMLNTHTIYAEQAYLLTLAQIHNLSKQTVI